MLVDTGSSVTINKPKLFEGIDSMRKLNLIATNIRLKWANGNNISAEECPRNLKLRDKLFPYTLIIAQIEISCMLGVDFMSKDAYYILIKEKVVIIQGVRIPFYLWQSGCSW